jgi:hypothetical protein
MLVSSLKLTQNAGSKDSEMALPFYFHFMLHTDLYKLLLFIKGLNVVLKPVISPTKLEF